MHYEIRPVGRVDKSQDHTVRLIIEPEFWDATLGIEHFSHLIILWWATGRDTPETRSTLQGTPPRIEGAKLSGVFAIRSNARPNPICHTIVKIESVDTGNHSLIIDRIDANDDTPIIDIKPYLPSSDRVDDARVPPWFEGLTKRYSR